MSANFEEIDYQETPIGPVSLRRQRLKMFENREIFEVKLGDDYLMSSLFTVVEEALSNLGLKEVTAPAPDVVVGGLGLGYTAATVLDHAHVNSLVVVDFLKPVIDWHERGLVPLGPRLTADPRCRFVHGDFFELSAPQGGGFDPDQIDRRWHAILLDIDHSPDHLLHPRHATFYSEAGLRSFSQRLLPGGIFGMWSDDPPEAGFLQNLRAVFADVRAEVVKFANPFLHRDSESTVYVCKLAG
jgi:spermidine synthase